MFEATKGIASVSKDFVNASKQVVCENSETKSPQRCWLAQLDLGFELRNGQTKMVKNSHAGPLRVLRPYYPEQSGGPCHIYLLHPPGGLVLGDKLEMTVDCKQASAVLLTTPSAGKVYNSRGSELLQQQAIHFDVASEACVEWLPQETIVYSGAHARLNTRFDLEKDARFFAWDIVVLGRPAADEVFVKGQCQQSLAIFRDGAPVFLERNQFTAGSELMSARWGLQGMSTAGTLLASIELSRDMIDELYERLHCFGAPHVWGLTQREDLFIARYIGTCAQVCRQGFELIWRELRSLLNNRTAVAPRIWST